MKNIITRGALAAAILAAMIVPGFTLAQTADIAALQAQIQSLLSQLRVLQARLAAIEGSAPFCHTFAVNLGVGSKNTEEVTALKTALQKEGFNPGGELPSPLVFHTISTSTNGVFDEQTASVVTGFQEKYKADILTPHGLQYGTGYVGPSTRAKLNSLYGCHTASGPVTIRELSPSSGTVGTSVTITGSGFTPTSNRVNFGPGYVTFASSPDGKTLAFTVPAEVQPIQNCSGLEPCGAYPSPIPLVAGATYQVSVSNDNGTSAGIDFKIIFTPILLSRLAPSSGPVGTTVTITAANGPVPSIRPAFTPTGNAIHFGAGIIGPDVSSADGVHLTFQVPQSVGPSCSMKPGSEIGICPLWIMKVTPGTYPVSVETAFGTSNSLTFTVVGTTPTSSVLISSFNPSSGPVGTQVTITGSGFTSDNEIHFDIGGIHHAASSDGTHLTFSVPNTVGSCDFFDGLGCMAPAKIVTPGTYSVSVENANGMSNSLTFTVVGTVTATSTVVLSALTPSSGPVGTSVTITGSGFTPTGNRLTFGNLRGDPDPSLNLNSSDGKTLIFTVPLSNYYTCWKLTPACGVATLLTQPGAYDVSVTNANGTSNLLTFTVLSASPATSTSESITLVNPVPDAQVPASSTQTISWQGKNLTQDVQLFSARTYGGAWTFLAGAKCCDTQSVAWHVPSDLGDIWIFIGSDFTAAHGWAASDSKHYVIVSH